MPKTQNESKRRQVHRLDNYQTEIELQDSYIWNCDVGSFLDESAGENKLDLIVSSPPYNIGKKYEERSSIDEYISWQTEVIEKLVSQLSDAGSICWQVGNYVDNGSILPLDYVFFPIFDRLGLKLRNRIAWHFGHGLHMQRRFSGRYEVVLWFTKSDEYTFNLDAVRVPPKYPGKRSYKGPNAGKLSSNPLGKNPEDVWIIPDADEDFWNIPNVKARHIEKREHPCQFPVALVERLVLALTNEGDLVFDPFAGTGSAGVAALTHGRRFWGCEIDDEYARIAQERLERTLKNEEPFRSHARPIYDHRKDKRSVMPPRLVKNDD